MPSSPLLLRYQGMEVGRISDPMLHQGTWFGIFQPTAAASSRALEFIGFCRSWNERCKYDQDAPDASEFDAFADLIGDRKWAVEETGGFCTAIAKAPNFIGDEVSWVPCEGLTTGCS